MVRRDDDRADQLRALGADVVVGDLTRAGDIVDAMDGVARMFFNMSVSPDYLRATAEVCAVALRAWPPRRDRQHVADDGVADDADEHRASPSISACIGWPSMS